MVRLASCTRYAVTMKLFGAVSLCGSRGRRRALRRWKNQLEKDLAVYCISNCSEEKKQTAHYCWFGYNLVSGVYVYASKVEEQVIFPDDTQSARVTAKLNLNYINLPKIYKSINKLSESQQLSTLLKIFTGCVRATPTDSYFHTQSAKFKFQFNSFCIKITLHFFLCCEDLLVCIALAVTMRKCSCSC